MSKRIKIDRPVRLPESDIILEKNDVIEILDSNYDPSPLEHRGSDSNFYEPNYSEKMAAPTLTEESKKRFRDKLRKRVEERKQQKAIKNYNQKVKEEKSTLSNEIKERIKKHLKENRKKIDKKLEEKLLQTQNDRIKKRIDDRRESTKEPSSYVFPRKPKGEYCRGRD